MVSIDRATGAPTVEKLVMVDDMGHDLPRPVWPKIIDAIVKNTKRAKTEEVVASAT